MNYRFQILDENGDIIYVGEVVSWAIDSHGYSAPALHLQGSLVQWPCSRTPSPATLKPILCECGSEAANLPIHSGWCPRSKK